MTLASRVEVFTELSCHDLHEQYNHTHVTHGFESVPSVVDRIEPRSILVSFPLISAHTSDASKEDDDSDNDPRVIPGKKCVSNPAVQAGAARLQVIMTTTMGALSALTTGWWGQFSERHGRTRVLAIAIFGLFLTYEIPILFGVCLLTVPPNYKAISHSFLYQRLTVPWLSIRINCLFSRLLLKALWGDGQP